MFLKRLNPKEPMDVQMGVRFFCAAPHYMVETFGREPTEDDGRFLVTDVPAGCDANDILVFAAFEKSTLLGLMQVQRHFERRELANIGLLLVDPGHRRRQVGTQMLAQLSRQARNWPDVNTFRITVVETNTAALSFWFKAGFRPVAQGVVQPHVRARVTVMERPVKHRPAASATAPVARTPAVRPLLVVPAPPAQPTRWLSAQLHRH